MIGVKIEMFKIMSAKQTRTPKDNTVNTDITNLTKKFNYAIWKIIRDDVLSSFHSGEPEESFCSRYDATIPKKQSAAKTTKGQGTGKNIGILPGNSYVNSNRNTETSFKVQNPNQYTNGNGESPNHAIVNSYQPSQFRPTNGSNGATTFVPQTNITTRPYQPSQPEGASVVNRYQPASEGSAPRYQPEETSQFTSALVPSNGSSGSTTFVPQPSITARAFQPGMTTQFNRFAATKPE